MKARCITGKLNKTLTGINSLNNVYLMEKYRLTSLCYLWFEMTFNAKALVR